ncbi:polyhydroxyalkanoate synthesis regulator DNA-binding domain-containing protein [Dichelobacter nodosus]|uniref:Polyhydroxyalkanoate synthesis repressor PhaR n=1 Tax=Dichelobacter nodosus (strain VCS1703A) TaxID=246195 RepID=A5EVC3_DICNV|nr:polyhydroxyalkanoate synthesis regulator DNA-binding domain-containing protein [Dichelobacter nodosus]ABQ14305.1 conserved hypothetical protein [Dichelobacter nodosus VCS1703A]AXM45485.1 polyhydroxyalkanoate synthesis repressor PhaR [Dichelobacter nodosus]TGA66679.1 polyhydroxyalkanoate synthesis repressor PhaR [Dichelobacter nodosus]
MATRQIKKYSNRRLYDTGSSRYIKTEDLRQLLLQGENFSVVDAQSGRDITRSMLYSILAEAALNNDITPVLTQSLLAKIVSFNNDYLAGILGRYLEQSLEVFLTHQAVFQQQMRNFDVEDPFSTIERLKNIQDKTLEELAAKLKD